MGKDDSKTLAMEAFEARVKSNYPRFSLKRDDTGYEDEYVSTMWCDFYAGWCAYRKAIERQGQELTTDEIEELGCALSNVAGEFVGLHDWEIFARAIEEVLKEKNR